MRLIKAYGLQLSKFSEDPANTAAIKEMVRLIAIELITSFNSPNFKIRKLVEESLSQISDMLNNLGCLDHLF